ncbi:MAG: hypothetical protein KGH65_02185 [Candidatus Micrarchaeota archaeon]|nr:hypothetical protein [Candidatus Micrarchaeota archaeon]
MEKGFLLLKPRDRTDANSMAKAISRCKGVKGVFLTSGEFGFVATVETVAEDGLQNIMYTVKRVTRCIKANVIVAHHFYKKR